MLTQTSDGSIVDSKGKVLCFSIKRFVNDISLGNNCFICGVSPTNTKFNNEHVLPKWLLKKHKLHNRKITLPNGSDYRYDRYVLPCCIQCNSLMNQKIEQPVQRLISKGYDAITDHLKKKGPWLFFIWFSLLYIKTYLKDKSIRINQDERQSAGNISTQYEWEGLHHIHCLARSFFTKIEFDKNILGSFLVLPAKVAKHYENFDFADMYLPRALLVRTNDIAFVSILNDSCGALNLCMNILNKKLGAFSPIQLREIFARMAFANLHLLERPQFFTNIDLQNERLVMSGRCPNTVQIEKYSDDDFGQFMDFLCNPMLPFEQSIEIKMMRDEVKRGRYTFLFDEKDEFIKNSMDLIEK
jgi:hypothetical protein